MQRLRKRLSWALVLALCLSGLVSGPATGGYTRTFEGSNGRIIFGGPRLRLIRPDGTGKRTVTPEGLIASHPTFSPDGRWVAFAGWGEGYKGGIYLMRPDGRNLHVVAPNRPGKSNGSPSWSPNGKKLAFTESDCCDGTQSIFTVHRDGSHSRRLTSAGSIDDYAEWIDNRRIIFVRRTRTYTLRIMRVGQPYVRRLMGSSRNRVYGFSLSSDGRWVAYTNQTVSQCCVTGGGVGRIRIDGTRKKQLLFARRGEAQVDSARMSPDGKRIAYRVCTARGTQSCSYRVMRRDGSEKKVLTGKGDMRFHAWSPNSKALVYSSGGYYADVLVAPLDGEVRRLAGGRGGWVAWQPRRR